MKWSCCCWIIVLTQLCACASNNGAYDQANDEAHERIVAEAIDSPVDGAFDGTSNPERVDGTSSPERFDETSSPERFDGTSSPERFDETSNPERVDGTSNPERVDETSSPERFDGTSSPERFDVVVDNIPLSVFLLGIVKGTPFNLVVHPEVEGNVFLQLQQVTVVDVLEIVRELFDLNLSLKGNLITIMPNTMQTQIFSLDYVNLNRQGSSDMRVSTGSIKDSGTSSSGPGAENSGQQNGSGEVVGSKVTTESATDLWTGLENAIESLTGKGNGRKVVIMQQAGIVVVRALRKELEVVGDFLASSQHSLQRQVVLEAKILEVVLNNRFASGIDWVALGDVGGEKGGPFRLQINKRNLANQSGLEGVFTAGVNLEDFGAIIDLLETQGNVKVLSSPRIATINNQKAVIKVGTDEFFVTNVSTTTTTGTSTTTTPSVTLTPFFSGIALDVTPQISAAGDVIMHIHPTVSEVSDQTKIVTVGEDTVNLPLALSTIRESDSIVKVGNGQVIVIGGLLKNVSKDLSAGVPLLSRIPLLGKLFSQRENETERSELVILVRPKVSEPEAQKMDVLASLRRIESMGI
ncbi:MAG: pilus (MSHA type) biogenesis protein MshL [Pseudomonadales bacterium]|nr:pilus (MSHA type) biogenesis protein MshL [Pseudomonadales bacterium]